MSDYAPNMPEPTNPSSGARRTFLVVALAALVALGVGLTVLLAGTSAHGPRAVAGQPTSNSVTSAAPGIATTIPVSPQTSTSNVGSLHGGSGDGRSSGGGGSGRPAGEPSVPRTTPPVLTSALEVHAFPTGPASVDESMCPAHLSFASVISVSRGPVVVSYRWIRSDGGRSPVTTVSFTGAGPQVQTVFAQWDIGGDYSGSEQLQVLTPFATTAAAMPFSVHCAPTVAVAGVSAAPAAGTCDSLATTLSATVTIGRSPVQVWYHWVVGGHAYPSQALPGTAVDAHLISEPFTFSTSVHGHSLESVRLVIDSPDVVTSSATYLSVDCA